MKTYKNCNLRISKQQQQNKQTKHEHFSMIISTLIWKYKCAISVK